MRINITGSLTSLSNKLLNIQKATQNAEFIEDLAPLIASSIVQRVQKRGLGLDGKPMKQYSPKYKERRLKGGRNVSYRDLTYSGKMFQSLTSQKRGSEVVIFFGSMAEKKKAYVNDQRTEFFGIGSEEKDIIDRETARYFKYMIG